VSRVADLSSLSERLTGGEIARLWFRRASAFALEIHADHPDFPKAGPDGLYLREAVKEWFDRWHGRRQGSGAATALEAAEAEALRIARHGRR
jgi:hypothetical protein